MARTSRPELERRLRLGLAWLLSALLVAIYFSLADGEAPVPLPPPSQTAAARAEAKLEVVEVSPSDANPGSAVTVTYVGASDEATVQVFAGKDPLPVLSRRAGSVIVRLPAELPKGRVKLRVASAGERSKPYDVRIKAPNWRKPFRSLVGGFALLVFGIGVFARGAREGAGLKSAHTLARLAARGPAALGVGAAIGALAQSTTAAAGLLSGLVASSLLAVEPAALAFLGAQLGAATAPLVTGLVDPREGLLLVALGVMWLGFASDRRASAFGRLVLGVGLMLLGLQTLRPGFEPFVQDPRLLAIVGDLRAEGALDVMVCALLGAALVAVLQGPAPVLVLVLVLAQTTAEWDLRTALAVLSGAGLGSAVGALLTTPRGLRGRRLAELNLALGGLSTLAIALSVDLWAYLADRLVPGVPHEIQWGKRVLLPNLGLHLGVAFACSQLAIAVLLLPIAPKLARFIERHRPERGRELLPTVGDPPRFVQSQLEGVLALLGRALGALAELTLEGRREGGRDAEHRLNEAHTLLEELLAGPVLVLPESEQGSFLARVAFASLQLERSLEGLHRQAERLIDRRVALAAHSADLPPLLSEDRATLREIHDLLTEAVADLEHALGSDRPVDPELALAREIRMNRLEARTRTALLASRAEPAAVRSQLGVLELVDAYEAAGNQVYRLSEALSESRAAPSAAVV